MQEGRKKKELCRRYGNSTVGPYILKAKKFAEPVFQSQQISEIVLKSAQIITI